MDKIKLFLQKNRMYKKYRNQSRTLKINIISNEIDLNDIKSVLWQLTPIATNVNITTVIFSIPQFNFCDKLTYILLECIIYSLIKDYRKKVYVLKANTGHNIITAGLESSHLEAMAEGKILNNEYVELFEKFTISKTHYKRWIKSKKIRDDVFSILFDDISSFLKNSLSNSEETPEHPSVDDYYKDVAEMVVELANNAYSHTGEDCLIDIDITTDWRREKDDKKFFCINIVVLNFSDILLHERVKRRISSIDNNNFFSADNIKQRYMVVKEAYNNHKKLFDNAYKEEDFFNIASFQYKISGRDDRVTGGTGLPNMLECLLEQSELNYCYMQSGTRGIAFLLDFLHKKDSWYGFNKTGDFICSKPSIEALLENKLFIPGCGFNLSIIFDQEDEKWK